MAWEYLTERRIVNEHGPQPIQLSEVVHYADLFRIADQEDREDLAYIISILDRMYLTHEYDRRAREQKKSRQRAARRRR